MLAIAASLIQEMKLGRDASPDVISVGLSATDYVGHGLGPGGGEMCLQLLSLDRDLEGFFEVLDAEGIGYNGPIDRGYESSIYLRDPNGVVVELMTWVTPVPDGVDEGDLILAAQDLRRKREAYAIEDEDVQNALASMGK